MESSRLALIVIDSRMVHRVALFTATLQRPGQAVQGRPAVSVSQSPASPAFEAHVG